MFGTRWRLFRLFGIPIYIDLSWLLILILLTWTLHDRFHAQNSALPRWDLWAMSLITALAFFVCIVLHEFGHALTARAGGVPIHGITLFLFGGVAEMEREPPSAGKEFAMAIAGPIVSLVLAIVFRILAVWGSTAGWQLQVVMVLDYLALINLTVLIFNMIPAFPLDGGRVLRSILWGLTGRLTRATRWASWLGRGFAWLLVALGILSFFVEPGGFVSGIWLVLIGLFLNNAAAGSYRQVLIRQALRGEPVSRFMTREVVTVPPDLDLDRFVDDYVYRLHRRAFPVTDDGHIEGLIDTSALNRYPREDWPQHTVSEAMRPDLDGLTIQPQADAFDALEQMQRSGSSRLLVTQDHHLVGIVSLRDLLRFLNLKLELEPQER